MTNAWNFIESNNDYVVIAAQAAEDDEIFNNFKKNSSYKQILEHVSYSEGFTFLSESKKQEFLLKNIEEFRENDSLGNADLYNYEKYGILSPSTARYIKNSMDIHDKFSGNMSKIVEIGGGYGGLAKTLSVIYSIDEYIIIDIPQVNMLIEKYLKKFEKTKKKFKAYGCMDYPEIKNIDLTISNYALSELNLEGQIEYCEKIIENSNNFYIIYNFIIPNAHENYEIIKEKLLKNFSLIEENESISINKILYGTKKKIVDNHETE
jgi:putative sugar O-methyltransferase